MLLCIFDLFTLLSCPRSLRYNTSATRLRRRIGRTSRSAQGAGTRSNPRHSRDRIDRHRTDRSVPSLTLVRSAGSMPVRPNFPSSPSHQPSLSLPRRAVRAKRGINTQ